MNNQEKVEETINNGRSREIRRDNQQWTIKRKWQHMVPKTQEEDKPNKKHHSICVEHHYTQTNTNNVNKTRVLVQTTGG